MCHTPLRMLETKMANVRMILIRPWYVLLRPKKKTEKRKYLLAFRGENEFEGHSQNKMTV